MGDSPDFPKPGQRGQRAWKDAADWVDTSEPKLTKHEQQELAHRRNRICKEKGCEICAPLREQRRLNKARRRADAQAQAHAAGQPCTRASCELELCVAARSARPATPTSRPPAATIPPNGGTPSDTRADTRADTASGTPSDVRSGTEQARAREAKRHKVGLPCGSEDCPRQECIDGFANERTRRHRARRPCRSTTCDNPVCVSARPTN